MNPINNATDNLPDSYKTIRSFIEEVFQNILTEYPLFHEWLHSISTPNVFLIVLIFNVYYLKSRTLYLILQIWFYYVIYLHYIYLYWFLVPKWQIYGFFLTANHIIWDRKYFGMEYNKVLYDHLVQKHYMQFLKKWRYIDKHGRERHPPMLTIYLTLFIFFKKYIYEGTLLYGLFRDIIWLLNILFFGGG